MKTTASSFLITDLRCCASSSLLPKSIPSPSNKFTEEGTIVVDIKVDKEGRVVEVKIGKGYRHFKGNLYEVTDIATHSETLEKYVVYRALYGEGGLWVRPLSMWNEEVTRDGKTYKRFTYEGESKQ